MREPNMKMIKITLDGEVRNVKRGTAIESLTTKERMKGSDVPVVAAMVNNRIRELNTIAEEGDDIRLLDIASTNGNRIYQRGLLHIFIQAAKAQFPTATVDVQHAVNEGIYCEICDESQLTPFSLEKIEREMRRIVERDEPFIRRLISRDEAIAFYRAEGAADKARLLRFREDNVFKVYTCGGLSDYFYGHMPLSTGYLTRFELVFDAPGCVLVYPQTSEPKAPLRFTPSPKLAHVFRQSEKWADILGCSTAADLNEMVERGELADFIRVNEALHEKTIAGIASDIIKEKRRVVLIAGPSSSGKTTFAKRLAIQLRASEKKTLMISLDNYYLEHDKMTPLPDGTLDLEALEALDVARFNDDLSRLLSGETVRLPRFDFLTKKSVEGDSIDLNGGKILLIEGIHGLNDKLTESISSDYKYKVYISALTQLNLDHHNRIPTTSARLLRRMVRDYTHRNAPVQRTLSMWESVRNGEDKWIFPNQETCDVMFNSTLVYELLFIKKLAYPLLMSIPEDDPCFAEANYLAKFLKYFVDPGDEAEIDIPRASLIREFIGGGCFED